MAQYGDKYEDAQNQEFDTQLVNEKANITGRGISTEATPTNGPSVVGHPQQEKLHRTGSLSSSSYEDEEEGDMRKKKGLSEKIMEKIPGVGPKEQQSYGGTTTTAATTVPGGLGEHGEEKKGMMEKIKEKLPGHN